MQPLSSAEFPVVLLADVPSAGTVVDEHLAEHGGLLIHLLLPDLLRFAATRFADQDIETSGRLLETVDRAFREGDDHLVNAIAVSFVEDVGVFPGESPEFIASWPPALLSELKRQQLGSGSGMEI